MNRPALFLLALALTSCGPAPRTQPPAPVLTLERLDADHVRAELQPAPVRGRWMLHLAAECGASDGPATGGEWPTDGSGVVVLAGRGDLFSATVTTADGQKFTVSDCIPEQGWDQAGLPATESKNSIQRNESDSAD